MKLTNTITNSLTTSHNIESIKQLRKLSVQVHENLKDINDKETKSIRSYFQRMEKCCTLFIDFSLGNKNYKYPKEWPEEFVENMEIVALYAQF